MKKTLILLSIILLVGCTQQAGTITRGNCLADECLLIQDLDYPIGELPVEVIEALDLAINDEYKARATYEVVINKFGSIKPFIMIIRSEEQHISSLKAIYDKYGVSIPMDPWTGNISPPDTIQASCALGVQAEIENAALYREELIPIVTGYEDITAVFNQLMSASENNHLVAFQRCD
jgi:hypothetical protein